MAIRSRGTRRANDIDARARELTTAPARGPGQPCSSAVLSLHFTPGTGSPVRWLFSSIWLVYLIQPVSELFGHPHGHNSALWIAGGLAITVAFCAIYVAVIVNVDRWPRLAHAGLAALVLLAALACVVYGQDWTALWIYVSAAAGMILAATTGRRACPARGPVRSPPAMRSSAGCPIVRRLTSSPCCCPCVLVGLAMIGFRMQIVLMRELAQARETVAKLAANEERLRLARDMHDLTGQSLSMITLKSDLAAKRLTRLPASAERDAVLGELGDIGRVSRQTLHDIREAVSGYRRPTLAIEVITARNALEAAGIRLDDDPELTLRSGTFDAEAEAALAWCLREAVTNVIRHSGARNCRIRLTTAAGRCPSRSATTAAASARLTRRTGQAADTGQRAARHVRAACPLSAAACRSLRPRRRSRRAQPPAGGFRLTATLSAPRGRGRAPAIIASYDP